MKDIISTHRIFALQEGIKTAVGELRDILQSLNRSDIKDVKSEPLYTDIFDITQYLKWLADR